MRRITVYAVITFVLAGCTGHDFVKPTPESLSLWTTTQDEIVTKFGQPYRQSTAIASGAATDIPHTPFGPAPVAGTFTHLTYYYQDRAAQVLIGGPTTERVLGFDFWNGKLYGYNFLSNFAADSSNFDETKAAEIERTQTTLDQIIDLLGAPTGQAVYPSVADPNDRKLIYTYVATEDRRHIVKRLEILLGADGKVRDLRFASESGPAPAPSGGGTVPVYIPTPRGK